MSAIQLLTKAGQAVDELARRGPSTPAELAKAISEPRPTVYRLVDALREIGMVRTGADGRIELGTAVLRWGDAVVEAFVDGGDLRKQLQWVREQLGMNVYFCVPRSDGALCLDHVEGSVVDMLDLGPGRTLPPTAGASSIALLAFGESRLQDEALARAPYEQIASGTPTTAAQLTAAITQAMHDGWVVDDSQIVEGVASIAVPVLGIGETVVGVLSVAGLRASVLPQAEAAARVLRVAAEVIARSIIERGVRADNVNGARLAPDTGRESARGPALIVKAGALMEALAAERVATSARLTELIAEPVSSVYRMLATLADIGWVEQIEHRGSYRVGGKLLSLARDLTLGLDIRRTALPVMTRIHEATGETTFLCVRHGTRAVCIERLDGVRVNSRVLRLGRSLPLHIGAAPRALLAFEDRESWEEYASIATLSEDLIHDVGSRSALYAQLDEVRDLGYALSDNTVTPGIAAVGAPIYDHRGRIAASLSVSGMRDGILADRGEDPSVTELVLEGARELSGYLGFDGFSR
ncbi:IclR family transcriptional regulator C-terminal domain-containing protein [Gordonia sp. CPCC 205515]|uniref:IclR family transcriptional regulator n=1 Tax=Gordonia sp. CPCC 205515 TaxID=3140791 RepID=UPI003AF391F6